MAVIDQSVMILEERSTSGGFASDQMKLRGDVAMVGDDIKKVIDKHRKSAYRTTSWK